MENHMTLDSVFGLVDIVATVGAAIDARRQRSKREKAVMAANTAIERTYGLLIGIKPGVASLGSMTVKVVDDGLEAINAQREALKNL